MAHRRTVSVIVTALALTVSVLAPAPALAAVFSCDEAGLDAAIAAGGGPHHFSCAAPTTIVTSGTKVITSPTTLDGDGYLTISGGGTHRVFDIAPGQSLTLVEIRVTGGVAPAGEDGGAIRGLGDDIGVYLLGSRIYGNIAGQRGGGIAVSGDRVEVALDRSEVVDNRTLIGDGGGVSILGAEGKLWAAWSVIADNFSSSSGGGVAAAVPSGEILIVDSTVAGNRAFNGGGGISVVAVAPLVFEVGRTNVIDNVAYDPGGGIRLDVEGGTYLIRESVISGNGAEFDGGGMAVVTGDGTGSFALDSVQVRDNVALDGQGGGLFMGPAAGSWDLSIGHSEFAGNRSPRILGGAVSASVNDGRASISDSLFAANSAFGTGGVVLGGDEVDVTGSAFVGNSGTQDPFGLDPIGSALYIKSPTPTVTGNCIYGNEFPAAYSVPQKGGLVDAENNWWGDPSGPSGAGYVGSGDGIAADGGPWDADPWAVAPLDPCADLGAPWQPGTSPSGRCEVLVWFDAVRVIGDTDADLDEWSVTGAMRFFDVDTTRDREIASTGLTRFSGDAGTEVAMEQQWRTEMWDEYAGLVRLDDVALIVTEDDGRSGDDRGSMRLAPNTLIACGETMSMSLLVPVEPGAARGQIATDAIGVVEVDLTITLVPVAGAGSPGPMLPAPPPPLRAR